MAITVADLRFFQSERMTDNEDGGGQMAGTEIVSGTDNQIFDDVSDVDRAAGDVSIRKVYAAVASANTDKYLDAGVVVFREPADPATSVLATTTASFYDERAAIQNHIENYLVQGPLFFGFLFGTQTVGARAFTYFCREADDSPTINQTLRLVQYTSTSYATISHSQYVRITRVLSNEVSTYTDNDGKEYRRRVVSCEISEALRYSFLGQEMSKDDSEKPLAVMYRCVVADAARYYGIRPMVAEATTGALSVMVDKIYDRIVPTSNIETPLLDFTASSNRSLVFPGGDGALTFSLGDTFNAGFAFNTGRAIVPGSLVITVSCGTLTDAGGNLLSGDTIIGTVDYSTGRVAFSSQSPTFSGSKTVAFQPGGVLTPPALSLGLPVTETTRYRTYVATLKPLPSPGTLTVDYLSKGNWYRLQDNGNGLLVGAASAYGAGTLNLTTGSVSVTIGALPDLYSDVIFLWSAGTDTLRTPETVSMQTLLSAGTIGIVPASVTLTQGATSLSDQGDGTLTGTAGTGTLNYSTGEMAIEFSVTPNKTTSLTVSGNRYTAIYFHQEPTQIATAPAGVISATLAYGDLIPGAVLLYFQVACATPLADIRRWEVATDDGEGGWVGRDGTINYLTGEFTLDTTTAINNILTPGYWYGAIWAWRLGPTGWFRQSIPGYGLNGIAAGTPLSGSIVVPSTVIAYYRTGATQEAFSTTLTVSALSFMAKQHPDTTLASSSLRFSFGGDGFYDVNNTVYRGYNPVTGAGTEAGTIDRTTGLVTLTDWPDQSASTVVIQARVERMAYTPATYAIFRTAMAPVAVGSFSLRVNLADPAQTELEASADTDGVISGSVSVSGVTLYAYGRIDYQTGTVSVYFGRWIAAAGFENEPWYQAGAVDTDGNILYPTPVYLDTLRYNCVTYTTLPLDAAMIGLDPVRLPSDGQVPLYRAGQLALIHHTAVHSENSLSPTQSVDMGRVRLYRVAIDDADGKRLPASFYSVNRETGIVTMASDLNLTGYTGPYAFHHTVADLSVIADADLSGRIALTKAISHTYPADDSRVSGVLYVGTMQARYTNLFAQSAWTSVWSDTLIGDSPLAQYNDVTYPLVVSNLGAYKDRFVLRFTSSTAFGCYGENLGYLGAGNINENFAPVNLLTGQPYFTMDYRGWGGGWSTGNCVRFNLVAACYPVDLIRAIQPSEPTGADDSVELLFLGNTD